MKIAARGLALAGLALAVALFAREDVSAIVAVVLRNVIIFFPGLLAWHWTESRGLSRGSDSSVDSPGC